MIVLDASVLANLVGDDGAVGRRVRALVVGEEQVSVPDLADVETSAVLRKRWLAGTMNEARFQAAVADLADLPLRRYPALPLLHRAFQLRNNVTPYDAMYVALAELLRCGLVTADGRLSQAPGIRCPVRVL